MVNIEKTTEALLKKFETKDTYENRKIVFWYDRDETLSEVEDYNELKEILHTKKIKLLILDENYFELKKIIEIDEPNTNFLIYSNKAEVEFEKNWLLDIQLYSSKFENSKIADIKSTFSIELPSLDSFIETYFDFFKNKTRISNLKILYQSNWREDEFKLGFFAVITNTKTLDFDRILRNLFIENLEIKENKFWNLIISLNLEKDFWNLIKNNYGYDSDSPNLEKLFNSFIITHINYKSKHILKGYSKYINLNKNNCEIFLSNWLRDNKDFDKYKQYSLNYEELNKETFREQFKDIKINEIVEIECLKFFDEAIILKTINSLRNGDENFNSFRNIIEARKGKVWYNDYKSYYDALIAAINLYEILSKEKIIQDTLSNLYDKYKTSYYNIDLFYRKFYLAFDEKKDSDILKNLREDVENLYSNKYLEKLLEIWSVAVDKEKLEEWKIGTNSMQNEFYKLNIKDYLENNNKVVVIISDALRYEVAVELKERLNQLRGEIQLKDLVGSLPSITEIGMPSLLPHKRLNFKETATFCDNISSEGISNRDRILKLESKNAIALKYNDFGDLKRNDKRELMKGKDIIYIYHDLIDATGVPKTENRVFTACEKAITEIYDLINELTTSINISNIIVTSDHGFLYKRDTLDDIDKLSLSDFSKELTIKSGKRYLLSSQDLSNYNNIHKFKLNYTTENYFVYVPKGILRFKTQGSGLNFVHGGLSPQEITIPVLSYKHLRSNSDLEKKQIKYGYVSISLLNQNRKITSNLFPISLYQTEKISDKLKAIKCKIALYDLDEKEKKVSDEKTILINSEDSEPEKRKYSFNLSLKSNIPNKKYYLKIYDEIQEKEIDLIPFEVDLISGNDFDDF